MVFSRLGLVVFRNIFFAALTADSTFPFVYYDVVRELYVLYPQVLVKLLNWSDTNWGPLSLTSCCGMPLRARCASSSLMTVDELVEGGLWLGSLYHGRLKDLLQFSLMLSLVFRGTWEFLCWVFVQLLCMPHNSISTPSVLYSCQAKRHVIVEGEEMLQHLDDGCLCYSLPSSPMKSQVSYLGIPNPQRQHAHHGLDSVG